MYTTEAWVIHEIPAGTKEPAGLRKEAFSFGDLRASEVLIEPIFGSWEGNMNHAIERRRLDVCRSRGEPRVVLGNSGVVLGNSGVVRVLRTGAAVTHLRPGELCIFFGAARRDAFGYPDLAHGYDAPGTVGVLAKQTKAGINNLFALPPNTRFSAARWAAFSLRYTTAWSNWHLAIGALRLQLSEDDLPRPHVWGWGGDTTLAKLELARRSGCRAVMRGNQR